MTGSGRGDQPPKRRADNPAKEQQQFGAVAALDGDLRSLPQSDQAPWERVGTIDSDERLRPDLIAAQRSEQRVTGLNIANSNWRQTSDHPLNERGFNALDSFAIGAEPLLAYDQGSRGGVDPENRRPFACQHVEERFNRKCVHCRQGRCVDGSGRTRMSTSESNQIFVRLFSGAEPLAKPSDGALLESNRLPHVWKDSPLVVKFLWPRTL